MRKYYTPVFKVVFVLSLIGILSVSRTFGQTTITTLPNPPYNGGNSLSAPANISFVVDNTNGYPVNLTAISNWCNTTENNSIWQLYYSATSLSGAVTDVTAPPFTLVATSLATPVTTNGITQLNFPGLSFTIPGATKYRFVLRNTGPGSTRYSGTGSAITPNTFTAAGVSLLCGDAQAGGGSVGYSGSNTALTLTPRYYTGAITFSPAGPCTNPPTPGTISSTQNPVCTGLPFTLSMTGGTGGTGQTFQWQISSDNTNWNNISGATNNTLTTSQTSSNYYRLVITCGATVNTSSLLVVTPAAVSGTYTINSGAATGGTNFQTFNDAYNYISCGINGPVIFNVVPGSGPYTEQLIINAVPGASATNTITFNGNGRILQFTSTNTNERAVIKLDGANWFRFDSLTINALATTTTEYGFGVQLLNDADSNIVRKCAINITSAQVSTNHAGISISASATSATTTGSTDCDDNLFDQNTITGGYYGITNVGSTTLANQRNKFTRNIIKDFYLYGIYNSGTSQTLIDGNDFSRPARSNLGTGTTQAIYFTSLSTSARVNGNYIHGLLDVNTASTNDAYGIYFTGVDALAGLENIVSNNAIYDIKSNGTIYGIYNAGSDNIFYYHNTISLDDQLSTSTEATRAFYQTTAATGIEFKNNIITLRRGGTGTKHALYFGTATSVIVSNYNDVFFTPSPDTYFGFSTTNHATINDWRTATGQDLNSVTIDPLYQNMAAGNLKPTSAALNNLGTPVGILTDIVGAPRSTTNPDMGAWEFDVGACTAPPTAGTATATPAGPLCPGELTSLTLTGNSVGTGQTYQWQSSSTLAGPWNNMGPVLTSPGFNINPTTTLYYRAAVTCSGSTVFSTPVQIVVNPAFPGGTYTINSGLPTGGTNFASFNDAYYALRCGIAGPVIFNVVVGSGPYTEQLVMGEVAGTSATNTVTWNGNGETIQFLSTNANERAVIKLNGTDHFIFDSLKVVALGTLTTEYGFGFHLTNDADSNIIRKSTININTTSTSTNYAGIVSSAGATATTTGTNGSDFNLIDDNTINGGYYSITSVGSTTAAVGNNRITRNRVRDFYFYGIYLSGNFNTLVEANDISRPNRADVSTFYGVYLTSLNTSVDISKNRIHNPFDGEPSATSAFGGVYLTGVDAIAGLENVISNNAIYNVNGQGTSYGLYNAGSDNALYYFNTVNIDGTSTSTNDVYGFYQTTAATGIDLKNNLITITRTSPGDKFLLYFATATSVITSNYNGFYKTGTNSYVGYNGANRVTLSDWQAATGLDANSVFTNPFYTNAATGDLEPRSPILDNKGTPVTGITTDIRNLARHATTPDIGAWEFTVPPCTVPPVAGTATANPNTNLCLGNQIQLGLTGNSMGAGQTYQWQFSTTAGGTYTNLGGPIQFPDTTINAAGTLWYRAVVTCGTQSANSAPVLVTMTPPFPAGTYTINNTIPTSYPPGNNFNSFAEAVAVMECGIAGPVTFNVAPGTYNEQIRMHAITGASATSRVTFQSANGNPASVILRYDATAAAQNYVLQLDSASYITFRAITINALNATNGRAVDIVNTASYDSLINNVINVPASTTTGLGIAGIYGSSLSGTDLVFKGNIVNGGTSGIHMIGTSTTIPVKNLVIDSNAVSGSYFYGIYSSNAQFTRITKNNVQVTAPRNTTSYGIYLTNNDSAYQVNANRVNITGTTTTVYGIYLTGSAAAGYTGSVSRNIVTALTGNTGTLYGIYQTTVQGNYSVNNVVNINTSGTTAYGMYSTGGTGGMKYYNNSVQNSSPATGTTNIAAYFSHTSSAAGIVDIRNNIFSHTANGIAMYQGNVANIYLDYNMFYTAGATLIRQGTINYATLQAWRNAENWDYSSIVYPPAFTAAPELQPAVTNPDSWAMHGRGVQIADNPSDINGNPRPTTLTSGVPDMGAYEFLPTVLPPVLPATPAAPAPGITQRFMFGTDTVQKITWGANAPTTVSVRRYSGVIPPGLAAGQRSMFFYTDDDFTGTAPTGFTKEQHYVESWMRDIPSEPVVKLGRTDATGAWIVGASSVVDVNNNSIRETNLSFLDKFTGMTDGNAPPPPPPPAFTTDTSNRGKRFWVGYGHHYGFSTNGQDMVLYLSAEDSANVTVKVNGTSWVRNYAIPANTVRVSDLLPESGLVDARLTDEGLFNRGISIESDVPIVAYAHIYEGATSGASLLLPTGTYGYEYRSLNSSQYYPAGGAGSYSWFFVVADRDSTLVEITPAVATKGGRPAGVPFQIYLMRGQIYNVMGTQTGAAGTDMSGSTVKSIPNASGKCYPIAVFSGSSRTAICNTTNGDNLIQQVFPNQAWGTKYLTFATANSASNTQYNSNKWRIMVKNPATVVRRNGTVIPAASLVVPGNYYEFGVTTGTGASTASYIEADQPVMVAQYMISSGGDDCPGLAGPTGNGDPEMIYISPIEQGIKKAVFYNTDESAITSNYINVIVPTAGLPSLRIDGLSTFTDVFAHPNLPGYTCVRHNLGGTRGQHTVQCDSAFTAITYGLGNVESYGYNAGTLVKNLSASPSITNVFSSGGVSSYTCRNTPFRLSIQISIKPTQLVWNLSGISNLSPNANVTQVNPTPTDSLLINGKRFYIYTLPAQYTFNSTGTFTIPINVFHPSIEGCSGSQEITLNVNVIAAPVANFTTNFTGCVGDVVQFNGTLTTSNGVPPTAWNWNFGDATTSTLQNPTKTYTTAGTYNVSLRGIAADGCVGDTTKPVVVNPRPIVAITQDTIYVCNNAAATFTVQNPVTGVTYNWYSAATGGTLLGTGTTFILNNVTGFVNVFLEGVQLGCASTTRDRATAGILPTLGIPVATVDSIGTNMLRFRWNAITGATGYQVSTNGGATWITPSSGPLGLTHTITNLTLGQSVTLQVRALGGCLPAVSGPVTGQTRTDEVFIPNSFSPNGDGLNDVLLVYSHVIRDMRFIVFNQWGEKIFESTNQGTGWDGRHKNKPQPSGVYIYVVNITLNTGEKIQRKGAVNLVR